MFYVAPLLLIALLAWIERGVPRPRASPSAPARVAAALAGPIPYTRLITSRRAPTRSSLLPLVVGRRTRDPLGEVRWSSSSASVVAALRRSWSCRARCALVAARARAR